MRIIKANSKLFELRTQLKEAMEEDDLDKAKEIMDKIEDISNPRIFKTEGRYVLDSRTGKYWRDLSEPNYGEGQVIRILMDNPSERLPTKKDFKELVHGFKDATKPVKVYSKLKKSGFKTNYIGYWTLEEFKNPEVSANVFMMDVGDFNYNRGGRALLLIKK